MAVKTYNDPVKALARDKQKEFIRRHFPKKKLEKLKVLCFPGAEAVGEEALEVREVYDELGVRRENIIGIEANKKKAQRLRDANLGIRVVEALDYDFLGYPSRYGVSNPCFDVISLDYTSYFGNLQRYTLDLIAGEKILANRGVLVTNYYGAREQGDVLEIMQLNHIISQQNWDGTRGMTVDFRREGEKIYSEASLSQIGDIRSQGILDAVISSMNCGRSTIDPLLIPKYFLSLQRVKELEDLTKREDLEELGISKGFRSPLERLARHRDVRVINRQDFLNKMFKSLNGRPEIRLTDVFWLKATQGYSLEDHESYSYVSNKKSPMLFDLLYFDDHQSEISRKGFVEIERVNDVDINLRFLEGLSPKKRFRELEKTEKLLERLSMNMTVPKKERVFLGSSASNGSCCHCNTESSFGNEGEDNERVIFEGIPIISKEDAIERLVRGESPREIAENYSGFSVYQLRGLKAVISRERNGSNGNGKRRIERKNIDSGELESLVLMVKSEIEESRSDEAKRLSTNSELAELVGKSSAWLGTRLRERLSEEEKTYRLKRIQVQTGTENVRNCKGIAAQTTEDRKRIGISNYESGKGIGGLTTEDRKRIGISNYESGKGIGGLTTEERREIGIIQSERNTTISFNGNFYHSIEEAAIARMLEEFIPGFEIQRGKTWQVNGNGMKLGAVDFFVNGSFVEYHPPVLTADRDLRSSEEYVKFTEIKERIRQKHGRERALEFQLRIEGIVKKKYEESRRSAIENSDYRGVNLIYCASPSEVYHKLIAVNSNNLDEKDFLTRFRRSVREIKEKNLNESARL
jgi:hypothetical protein